MGVQDLLNSFYNIDSLIRIQIDIPEDSWDELRHQEPKGTWGYKGRWEDVDGEQKWVPGRYDWHRTTSVTISGSDFQDRTFKNVGLIKKSFAGSKDHIKPSFRLDFSRFQPSNEEEIEALIGTKTLVLNNCKQDPTYLRQPLGYRLLKQAGVPSFRCNLATVRINYTDMGVYVNIEAFKKPFLEACFNGNTKGNAYELELQQDLVTSTYAPGRWQGTPSFEGYSKYDNEKDIKLACQRMQDRDWKAVHKMFDIDAFIKFFAMESLLKHSDGFTQIINNTFIYNDTTIVAAPGMDNIRFKFVPSGIDAILVEGKHFTVGRVPAIARMILGDDETKGKLYNQVRACATGEVFSEKFYSTQLDRLCQVMARTNVSANEVSKSVVLLKGQLEEVKKEALKVVG